LRADDFLLQFRVVQIHWMMVGARMIDELVCRCQHGPGGVRVQLDIGRHRRKRHVDAFFGEQRDKLGRMFRERPVIENKRNMVVSFH